MQRIIDLIVDRLLPCVRSGNARIVPDPEVQSIDAHELSELGITCPRHHPFFEWFWVVDGTAHMKVNDSIHPVAAGDFCLLPPGISHIDMFGRHTPAYRALWFSYAAGCFHVALFEYEPFGRWRISVDSYFLCTSDAPLMLECLQNETSRRAEFSRDVITGLLLQLMVALLRDLRASVNSISHTAQFGQTSAKVVGFLLAHYHEPLTLERVAREVNLNPNYLTTRFKQETGQTVFEKLAQIRLEQATRLIVDRNFTIDQVARAVGFHSADSFARAFRKAKGVTPSRYGLHANTNPAKK